MYQGKRYHTRYHIKSKKSAALLVSLILLLCMTVGGTVAFLMDTDGPIDNVFTASQITTRVDEELDGYEKSNVKITNTGNVDAYIRAAVIVTWQDKDGNVYGRVPVLGEDYKITYNTSEQVDPAGKWILAADGFYYWSNPVAGVVGNVDGTITYSSTGVLIEKCTTIPNSAPDGYFLNVEIVGSGIQSVPKEVVKIKWSSGVSGFVKDTDGNETDTLSIKGN